MRMTISVILNGVRGLLLICLVLLLTRLFGLRARGLLLKKFFDDSDSDGDCGGESASVRESLPRRHSGQEEKAGSGICETIDFAPSYVASRTQKRAAPKQAAAAAAATAAATITSRLLACEAHSVAAPSVKPLQLQVSLFLD